MALIVGVLLYKDVINGAVGVAMMVFAVILSFCCSPLFLRGLMREYDRYITDLEHLVPGQSGQRLVSSSVSEWNFASERINDLLRHAAASNFARQAERERLRQIIDAMSGGLIALDRDGVLVLANDQGANFGSCRAGSSVGRKLWEWIRLPSMNEVVHAVLEAGGRQEVEIVQHRPAADRILSCVANAVTDDEGNIVGATIMLVDISALRHLEGMRRDFIANVSHELKTPLTAIRGMTETILDDPDMPPAIRNKFMGKIANQSALECIDL